MQDARARVRGLLREQQFAVLCVECDTPVNQLTDARRTFLDKHAHRIGTAESTACGNGVLVMQFG